MTAEAKSLYYNIIILVQEFSAVSFMGCIKHAAWSHCWYLFDFSPLCLSNVTLDLVNLDQSNCICLPFLRCAFQMSSQTASLRIGIATLHYGLSNEN